MLYQVSGTDQFGRSVKFQMDIKPEAPELFFWLGAEADRVWPVIERIVPEPGARYTLGDPWVDLGVVVHPSFEAPEPYCYRNMWGSV